MRRARISDIRIGFEAFCEANRESYVRYAEKWVDDLAEARRCVEAVFDALEPRWVSVLGTQSPAARVWEDLRAEAAHRTADTGSPAEKFHAVLRDDQADIVLLHHDLRLPLERAARLMGLDRPIAQALLRGAERDLSERFEA
ncbi:hypothetical protein ACFVP0_32925 [Streptomyces cinereoruber]|uniref:hypothetical protein n=1 Tax=Streptomyces cinereoruber TaxID=67260 RepID=UPI0036A6E1CE